jgi:hypothetical protein
LIYRRVSPTATEIFDPGKFAGYSQAQMGTILWRRGTNFLEVERWDQAMRGWGFTKSLRQTVMLVAGIQPQFLMLTTHADNFYYNSLRTLLWTIGAAYVFFNFLVLALIFRRFHLSYVL